MFKCEASSRLAKVGIIDLRNERASLSPKHTSMYCQSSRLPWSPLQSLPSPVAIKGHRRPAVSRRMDTADNQEDLLYSGRHYSSASPCCFFGRGCGCSLCF